MGASGWDYREPFVESVPRTLQLLQQRVLAGEDYLWPWEDMNPDYVDDDAPSRPTTLSDLVAAKEREEFWDEGTHSILDMDQIASVEATGALVPLTAEELDEVFGTHEPSADDVDRITEPGEPGPLVDLVGERWTGRYLTIYSAGTPTEVYFWGCSGD